MSEQIYDFHERVHRINRKRAKANRSMRSTFVDSDGYVIVRAKSRARGLPFLGLFLLTMGFFALKSVMIAQLGQEAYDLRIQPQPQNDANYSSSLSDLCDVAAHQADVGQLAVGQFG
jgi:hypothetical protein